LNGEKGWTDVEVEVNAYPLDELSTNLLDCAVNNQVPLTAVKGVVGGVKLLV